MRPKLLVVAALLLAAAWFFGGWVLPGPLTKDTEYTIPEGAGVAGIADELAARGAVRSAFTFNLRGRILGGSAPIKAGTYLLPKGASQSTILDILKGGKIIRRFVTVPEGMPSAMVFDRLNANTLLTGKISIPAEGTILPDTYEIAVNEDRGRVVQRMQAAMASTLAELWAARANNIAVSTPQEAVILASIVEKETGKPSERPMVAGLYGNRLRIGMPLQADPTIIYPITKGRPLGRRILKSEIRAVNGYNTYSMAGLPKGPITNPGRASIEAVLHPAATKALYMVADGTGGHMFADTLDQHNANVAKWMKLRRERGEIQ